MANKSVQRTSATPPSLTLGDRQKMKTAVLRLTEWYSQQCNGDWEHSYGFTIDTLDNPGVSVSVDLLETELESVPFEEKKEDYESADRWMICMRSPDKFVGRGAPGRLEHIIEVFLGWVELHRKEPIKPPQTTTGSCAPDRV